MTGLYACNRCGNVMQSTLTPEECPVCDYSKPPNPDHGIRVFNRLEIDDL